MTALLRRHRVARWLRQHHVEGVSITVDLLASTVASALEGDPDVLGDAFIETTIHELEKLMAKKQQEN